MEFVWKKPVLTFYRDKSPPEREAFVAVKAKKLAVSKSEDGILRGNIEDTITIIAYERKPAKLLFL